MQAGHLNLATIKTIPATESEISELRLRRGDVLLTEGGDHDKLGRGAMLEADLGDCMSQLRALPVMLPPLGDQSRFAQQAARVKGLIDGQVQSTTLATRVMEAILTQVFA